MVLGQQSQRLHAVGTSFVRADTKQDMTRVHAAGKDGPGDLRTFFATLRDRSVRESWRV